MDWKINHLTALVQCLVGNKHFVPPLQIEDEEEEEDCVFPLMSMEDLDRLEQRLMDRGTMQKCVRLVEIMLLKWPKFWTAFNPYLISVLGEQVVC